jgi:putative ABC transport system substrate-binding protein
MRTIVAAGTAWLKAVTAWTSTERPMIAFLSGVSEHRNRRLLAAFIRGLRELDDVEGHDFDIVTRFAEGRADRLPLLVKEIIESRPRVILTGYTPAAVAARAVTSTIPIVCPLLADPVGYGLIASQSHPGGNVTGILSRGEGLTGKQLEIAAELVPGLANAGLLLNVASPIVVERQEAESVAQSLGVKLLPVEVRRPDELDTAFQALVKGRTQAVIVLVDAMFFNERPRIAALAAAARLPAVYGFRDHVDAGGLISYGVDLAENFHRAATYVHKILKGANPADLPVEFPTKFELVINLKAAARGRGFGLSFRSSSIVGIRSIPSLPSGKNAAVASYNSLFPIAAARTRRPEARGLRPVADRLRRARARLAARGQDPGG